MRIEGTIENPTFTRPIDSSANKSVRFVDLAERYADSTKFVSSFEGLRSFPSYAEIVKRGGSVILPAIARTLEGRADAIGLALAFEDIQANLSADGFKQEPVTAGAVTLEEKRARILDWAEDESIIQIRSAEKRIRTGVNLFGLLERGANAYMTPDQKAEYDNPPDSYSRNKRRSLSVVNLVLKSGQEATIHHEFGKDWAGAYHKIGVFDKTPGRDPEIFSVKLITDSTGGEFLDAVFSGEKTGDNTHATEQEITQAARRLFGNAVDLIPGFA